MKPKDTPRVLHAVARDHIPEDIDLLPGILERIEKGKRSTVRSTTRIIAAFVLVLLALVAILASVPGAANAMKRLFGYIPGVGVVEQGAPMRVLAEPVSITRQGITFSVNRAYLAADKTSLDTGISGVPLSAYPQGEAVTGCIQREYLRLPDGTQIDVSDPIPSSVNEATFVMPCIFNTLPGTVPTDWELALRFVPAPPDLTVFPIIEVSPSAPPVTVVAKDTPGTISKPASTKTSTPPAANVSVEKVIETEDGYILIGSVRPQLPAGSWIQITGPATIRDARGKKVSYSYPNDVQPMDASNPGQGGYSWALQYKGTGVTFPVTIGFTGVVITQVDRQASAQIIFDAGSNPQPGQVWSLNREVQLAGYPIQLISITANSDGYSFQIDPGVRLSGATVQIAGHETNGGGGGGGWKGEYTASLSYNEMPKGELTIVLSNPLATSDVQTWQGQWQPETARLFATEEPAGASSLCLSADAFQALKPLPAGLDGKVLLTELNPGLQVVFASFDGSQRQVLATGSGRAALSADGTWLAYPTAQGIAILNLVSGETFILNGIQGRDLSWSPDGSQIAYVTAGEVFGVFVTGRDGKAPPRQLSDLGYETIAGWSPDGKKLFFAIPGSTNEGFLLKAADLATGKTSDLFVLLDSSRKAPLPAVSPDGNWVAYRGSDNASLYLIRIDGSQAHKVIEPPSPDYAVTGIAWGPGGSLLGVSLMTPDAQDGKIILLQPEGCEAYLLASLHGELDGLFIP